MNDSNLYNHENQISFWDSLTGAVVKITALIIAITGLIFAVKELVNKPLDPHTTTDSTNTPHQQTPQDKTDYIVQPGSTVSDNLCPSQKDTVSPKSIETTGSDAVNISGDTEMDSNDWTGVELSYTIEKTNSDREIRINFTWYSQEKNADHSNGDTRIKSSKTMSLYKIEGCPELVIGDINGLELQGTKSQDFQGKIHGFVAFPDCGSLRGITVQFDAKGENDVPQQHLNAQVPSFTVNSIRK